MHADAKGNELNSHEQCHLPGVITRIAAQARRSDRVNVYVDECFCFSCQESVAADFRLGAGVEISKPLRDDILREDAFHSAYAQAIDLLAHRARTEREIQSRLRLRRYDNDVIARVIQRLVDNGYLDDVEFARFWIENRVANRPRGDRALRQELVAKGVDAATISEALDEAGLDQNALAVEAGRNRMGSLSGLPPDVQRRRMIGYLQRRGFSWDAIKPALSELLDDKSENVMDCET